MTFSGRSGTAARGPDEPQLAGALRAARIRQERLQLHGDRLARARTVRHASQSAPVERGRARRHGARRPTRCSATAADGTYAGIDRSMAHLNIPATLAWARGLDAASGAGHVPGLPDPTWTIATQLFPTDRLDHVTAPNVQYLMDSPVHLGAQSWHRWPVASRREDLHDAGGAASPGTTAEADRYVDATRRKSCGAGERRLRHAPGLRRRDLHLPVDVPPVGSGRRHGASQLHVAHQHGCPGHLDDRLVRHGRARVLPRLERGTHPPASLEPFDFERRTCRASCGWRKDSPATTGRCLRRAAITTLDQYAPGPGWSTSCSTPRVGDHSAVQMSRRRRSPMPRSRSIRRTRGTPSSPTTRSARPSPWRST